MSKFAVIHSHRFGTSFYLVESANLPTTKQLVRCLGLDYEPDRDESIEVFVIDSDMEIKVMDWQEGDNDDDEEEDDAE